MGSTDSNTSSSSSSSSSSILWGETILHAVNQIKLSYLLHCGGINWWPGYFCNGYCTCVCCTGFVLSTLIGWPLVRLRATAHTRLRAHDHFASSTLIGGKRRSWFKFTSHYAWGTNRVCECKMGVESTWIPTWHLMDHVSWSAGLFSKTASWR